MALAAPKPEADADAYHGYYYGKRSADAEPSAEAAASRKAYPAAKTAASREASPDAEADPTAEAAASRKA